MEYNNFTAHINEHGMLRNIKLTIAYDGTAYFGWQKTSAGPSIEASLQATLQTILQEEIFLQAASRTDAGVHAEGQVVNFNTNKENLNLEKLIYGLNCLLPKDIVVLEVSEEHASFHPTLHNKGKEYHYYICNQSYQLPQYRYFSWHYPFPLIFDEMQEAAKALEGTHNFAALCNYRKNMQYQDYERTIDKIIVSHVNGRIRFEVIGSHFLYKMVRNIVGLIVYIGNGKIDKKDINRILLSRNRVNAGITAPAHGLTLHKVFY